MYLGLVGLLIVLHERMTTAFLPDEDQGILIMQVTLPSGATLERTREVLKQVEKHFWRTKKRQSKS